MILDLGLSILFLIGCYEEPVLTGIESPTVLDDIPLHKNDWTVPKNPLSKKGWGIH